jgi:hypothetical protein
MEDSNSHNVKMTNTSAVTNTNQMAQTERLGRHTEKNLTSVISRVEVKKENILTEPLKSLAKLSEGRTKNFMKEINRPHSQAMRWARRLPDGNSIISFTDGRFADAIRQKTSISANILSEGV